MHNEAPVSSAGASSFKQTFVSGSNRMKIMNSLGFSILLLSIGLLCASCSADQSPKDELTPYPGDSLGLSIVEEARKGLNIPYRWNGRNTEQLPGFDCMGLCFRTIANIFNKRWRDYSVMPTTLIESGAMGKPIDGKAHPYSREFACSLHPGDVIHFLFDYKYTRDDPLVVQDSVSYWVCHMGIASGNEQVIHASPWDYRVVEVDLAAFREGFWFYVTRRTKILGSSR